LMIFFIINSSRKSIENKFVKEEKKYAWSAEGLTLETESLTASI
jgi:hypothetical protein